MEERALAQEDLADSNVELMRRQMDEARARRLQPHYIEWTFRTAFDRLGGRMAKREKGRWEISHVPSVVRAQQPPAGAAPAARLHGDIFRSTVVSRAPAWAMSYVSVGFAASVHWSRSSRFLRFR